jgi:hypothetical protein
VATSAGEAGMKDFDEIEQRRAHMVNKAWVRSMPDEMLARWYKLVTDEHERRERIRALDIK